jgi:hypothetical protein
VIPGFDREVLSGNGLRIDGGDRVLDVTARYQLRAAVRASAACRGLGAKV